MAKQEKKETPATTVADVSIKLLEDKVQELTTLLNEEASKNEVLQADILKAQQEKATAETLIAAKDEEIKVLKNYLDTALQSDEEKAKTIEVEVEEVDERPIYTISEKGKFRFKKTAPKNLKVLGVAYSQAELIKNKEAMEFLIYGNSFFVEQVN